MSRKSKDDPMQLKMQLTFTNPTAAVVRQLATLMEIADGGSYEASTPPDVDVVHRDGRASDARNEHAKPEQVLERHRLRRLAGCIAIATNRDWHEVWVMAYHRFFKVTGRHPVSESIRLGLPTHLDFVFSDPSWPGVLHNVLDEMLTEPNTVAA